MQERVPPMSSGPMSQDSPSSLPPLILTEKRGHIAILTLNRPDALNALGAPGDGDQVAAACEAINDDQEIRCVILTGAGRAFSAGGDVKAMKAREGAFGGNGVKVRDGYRKNIHRVVRAIYGLEVPSIAAVNGAAIGLGCDVAALLGQDQRGVLRHWRALRHVFVCIAQIAPADARDRRSSDRVIQN